jgi:hypothetical protein
MRGKKDLLVFTIKPIVQKAKGGFGFFSTKCQFSITSQKLVVTLLLFAENFAQFSKNYYCQ